MKINSLRKAEGLRGKRVFVRTDFNVPIAKGKVLEDHKIIAGLETIIFLSHIGAKVIVASHLGDPRGRKVSALSLKPVADRLRKLSGQSVKFHAQIIGGATVKAVEKLKDGEIILLENLRFNQGEYNDAPVFAASLAELADIYVNDAFAVSHRSQASVSAIKKYLPSYAGLLLEKEILSFQKIIQPKKPLVVVLGGAKISTKAPLIKNLHVSSSKILIGGALANNFLRQSGREIGKSLFDEGSEAVVKSLLRNKGIMSKLILPVDYVVKRKNGRAYAVSQDDVQSSDKILDIGPESIKTFSRYIKKAKTLFWNGPMGKFEERSFRHGTLAVASLVAARSSGLAYGVVGGGETVAALKLAGLSEYIDWVSTGGGASLSYIGGVKMPGLKGIIKA